MYQTARQLLIADAADPQEPAHMLAPGLCWNHGATGLGMLDDSLAIVEGNHRFFSLLSMGRQEVGGHLLELAGFKPKAIEHIHGILRARGHWKGVVRNEQIAVRLEIDSLGADPEDRGQYCVALIDYTDDYVQYRNLSAARLQAERTDKAKSQFLSHMSHELRTPLNAILGFAQLLALSDHLDEVEQDNVREIEAAGQYLLTLINEILDLSKIESGKLKLSEDNITLDFIFDECVALVSTMARSRPVALDQHIEPNLQLVTDHVRFKQVLINLLSNAIKYNVPGGEVVVRCHRTPRETLRIEVQDSGRGIAPEKLDSIFSPFERLAADDRTIEGTGIGLMITRQLVKLMHGEIGVFSEVGRGSVFWLEFPLANASGAQLISDPDDSHFMELPSVQPLRVCWLGGDPAVRTRLEKLRNLRPALDIYELQWPLPDHPLFPVPEFVCVSPEQAVHLESLQRFREGLKHTRLVVVNSDADTATMPASLADAALVLAADCKLTTLLKTLDIQQSEPLLP